MSHNPRFTLNSSIKNISISHRGRQVIHDSFLRNKSQITRPLYITDPRGQSTTYSYDIVDNLTQVNYPNGTTEHFSYDKNGNLLTRTVPTPAEHRFSYNAGAIIQK